MIILCDLKNGEIKMNEYFRGHIDACDKLFDCPNKFKESVKKCTRLTESGFSEDKILQEMFNRKMDKSIPKRG